MYDTLFSLNRRNWFVRFQISKVIYDFFQWFSFRRSPLLDIEDGSSDLTPDAVIIERETL